MAAKRHIILGAGATGLMHAFFALNRGEEVVVYDAASQAGGMIQTRQLQHGIMETAANGFLNNALFETMAQDLGLSLLPADKAASRRYIYDHGKFRRLPLSWGDLLRLLRGFAFKNAQVIPGESLADWASRVLGPRVVDAILQPAFGGIYAGDVRQMSAELVLAKRVLGPGSMLRQIRRGRKVNRALRPRQRCMMSFKNGMGSFMQALADYISKHGSLNLNQAITADNLPELERDSERLTIATGLSAARPLLQARFPELTNEIQALRMFSLATITRFGSDALAPEPGFGVLFRPDDAIQARGILFNHNIFTNRAHDDLQAETYIYGGAFDEISATLSEAELLKKVDQDRFKIKADSQAALEASTRVWQNALPAYDRALLDFNRKLDQLLPEHIRAEGNYRGGIGLSAIIERAAQN